MNFAEDSMKIRQHALLCFNQNGALNSRLNPQTTRSRHSIYLKTLNDASPEKNESPLDERALKRDGGKCVGRLARSRGRE